MESNSFVVLADILSCVATSPTNQSRTSSRTSCTRTARTSTWKLSSCIGMVIGPISIISLLIRPRCISIFLVMISFRSTNLCIISACAALIADNVFFLFFFNSIIQDVLTLILPCPNLSKILYIEIDQILLWYKNNSNSIVIKI